MRKSADAFRTISEVAQDLDLPQHVLRFWETRFSQIKPMKRGGGRRYYRPDDIDLLRGIRHLLYDEGYTIKGVQKILKEQGVRHVIDTVDAAAEEAQTSQATTEQQAANPAETGSPEPTAQPQNRVPTQAPQQAPQQVLKPDVYPAQDMYQPPHPATQVPLQNQPPAASSKPQPIAHPIDHAQAMQPQQSAQAIDRATAGGYQATPEALARNNLGDVNSDVTGSEHTAAGPRVAAPHPSQMPQAAKMVPRSERGVTPDPAPAPGAAAYSNPAPQGAQGRQGQGRVAPHSMPSSAPRQTSAHGQDIPHMQPVAAPEDRTVGRQPVAPAMAPGVNAQEDNQPLPPDLRSGDPQFLQGGRSASLSVEEARLRALQEEQKSGFFSRFMGGRSEASDQELAAMTQQSLSRDEIRRLQSTLFELLECKRILDQALSD
ncbi:DNA-binding transcriptional regulator, MerR family [Cohaesibacter marisflavi]|uniref:DNA-binding transcriptional regulator, MerR family n=1 Tax=Cohaesibacter marisflavi TaxID=655353 RepID=A0A1I5B2H4_9HYPH|nr:DNA-binding transcriptional regulator, MerR family [Cohaesibacter marisflavi]